MVLHLLMRGGGSSTTSTAGEEKVEALRQERGLLSSSCH